MTYYIDGALWLALAILAAVVFDLLLRPASGELIDVGSCTHLSEALRILDERDANPQPHDREIREKLEAWMNREHCPKYRVELERPLREEK